MKIFKARNQCYNEKVEADLLGLLKRSREMQDRIVGDLLSRFVEQV